MVRRRPAGLDRTLGKLVELRADDAGGRRALRSGDGRSLTFAELAHRVGRVRGWRTAVLRRGDRVALVLRNTLHHPAGAMANIQYTSARPGSPRDACSVTGTGRRSVSAWPTSWGSTATACC